MAVMTIAEAWAAAEHLQRAAWTRERRWPGDSQERAREGGRIAAGLIACAAGGRHGPSSPCSTRGVPAGLGGRCFLGLCLIYGRKNGTSRGQAAARRMALEPDSAGREQHRGNATGQVGSTKRWSRSAARWRSAPIPQAEYNLASCSRAEEWDEAPGYERAWRCSRKLPEAVNTWVCGRAGRTKEAVEATGGRWGCSREVQAASNLGLACSRSVHG